MNRWPPLKQKIRKRKLEELSEYATTMHNADAERIRREIISASKRSEEKMENKIATSQQSMHDGSTGGNGD